MCACVCAYFSEDNTLTDIIAILACTQNKSLTIGIWCLTEREKVYYRIVHLQHSSTLPMHYCQTRTPAHCVVRQTTRKDYEGFPGTHTSFNFS